MWQRSFWLAMIVTLGTAWAGPVTAQPLAPDAARADGGGDPAACADGLVPDDGSAESGYGWVPSVIEGEFVQEIDSSQLASRRLESVCICWLRTRADTTIDFEIVFYKEELVDGVAVPAAAPYAAIPASAEVTPLGIAESFFEIDATGIRIPRGRSFIGARWDASVDQFFFICVDQSEPTPLVEAFFRDDRSKGEWTSVFETTDPIFDEHRAMMIRVRAKPAVPVEIPALGGLGLALLTAALATAALAILRRY